MRHHITNALLFLKEVVPAVLLATILAMMIVAVTMPCILNVPNNFWHSGDTIDLLGATTIILGPTFTLTRVAKW